MKERLIIKEYPEDYALTCDYLKHELGFEELHSMNQKKSSRSKRKIIFNLLGDFFFFLKNWERIRKSETIFSIGFISIFSVILIKFRLIKPVVFFWWGFFIHNPRLLPILRIFFGIFLSNKIQIIVFSEFEKSYYHQSLHIPLSNLKYVPYGNWKVQDTFISSHNDDIEDYYFSGGYSNRDYLPLIKIFNANNKKLIIVASKLNTSLKNVKYGNNITIYKNINSEKFDEILKKAKACIFCFKHNSGASGQSVMLRCMKFSKLVITTYTDVIKEYVVDEVSGIILNDINHLPNVLEDIEKDYQKYEKMGLNGNDLYKKKFSFEGISRSLKDTTEEFLVRGQLPFNESSADRSEVRG